ncbi:MAG: hypothetical protein LBQ91_01790 [Oscillospiraceae bacterium]|jgi:hypothetical protein|nr:hypothetical protein [Oscillospiraceae bacterium]
MSLIASLADKLPDMLAMLLTSGGVLTPLLLDSRKRARKQDKIELELAKISDKLTGITDVLDLTAKATLDSVRYMLSRVIHTARTRGYITRYELSLAESVY